MIRWVIEQSTRFKIPFRVEITDSEYSGSPIELDVAGQSPLITDGGQRNADPLRKVFGEGVEVRMRGKEGDFDDLFTRDNERFRIKVYRDGEFDSEYIPLTDASSEPVTKGTYEFTLQGRGLASLKEVKVLDILDEGRHTYLDGVYDIVNHFFDYDVVDGSIFYPSGANQNTSALSQFTFSTDRWDEETTAYEALESLMMKTHQLRVHEGDVVVVPVTSASFTGYRYNGTSISSGITFDNNFIAQKIGGRLSTTRSKLQSYDGVRRIYDPGETPNLVRNGDFDREENFTFTSGSLSSDGRGHPADWTNLTGKVGRIEPTGSESTPIGWQLDVIPPQLGLGSEWESPAKTIIKGQRLKFSTRVGVSSGAYNDTWVAMVSIKLSSALDTKWVTQPAVTQFRGLTQDLEWGDVGPAYIPIFVTPGSFRDFASLIPPAPINGEISIIVGRALPRPLFDDFQAGSTYSMRPGDFVEYRKISIDGVDEDGEIIRQSETLAGSRGDIYEYTELFGDGFTGVTPGAIYRAADNQILGVLTDAWRVKGIAGIESLSRLQTKYLASELTKDRDKIQGTVDTFDTLALIEGKRVNYIRTDWRYGRSEIELVEIQEHDLELESEDRRETGSGTGLDVERVFPDREIFAFKGNSIGELLEDVNGSIEEVKLRLKNPVQAGKEYFVVNEGELSRDDPDAGIYPFNPVPTLNGSVVDRDTEDAVLEYGPGAEITVPIRLGDDAVYINAPEGSPVVKTPGQIEIDDNVHERRIEEGEENIKELNEVKLPLLDDKLDELDDKLDELDDELEELNDVVLPNLQNELNTLDGYFDDPSTIPGNYNFFEGIVAENIFVLSLVARELFVDELAANTVFTDKLVANNAFINELVTRNLFAEELVAFDVFTEALVAKEIWVEQLTSAIIDVGDLYAQDATIRGQLTMGSEGVITNASDDFFINNDGYSLERATSNNYSDGLSPSIPRSYKIEESGTVTATIYGAGDDIVFSTNNQNKNIVIAAGSLAQFDPPERDILFRATGDIGFVGNNINFKIEESSATSNAPSGENGRIRVNVNGSTRWIKLFN